MRLLHTGDWHLGKRLDDYSRLEEQQAVLEELIGLAEIHDVDAVLVAGDLFDTFNPPAEAVELFYKSLKKLSGAGRRPVIAIAGNHDSPDRIEAPDPLARECGIVFAGYPHSQPQPFKLDSGLEVLRSAPGFLELRLPRQSAPLRMLLTPYANEYRLKTYLGQQQEEELRQVLQAHWAGLADQYCDAAGVNILLSHLFVVEKGTPLPDEPLDEKPILHVGGAQAIYTENIPPQVQYAALGHLHRMHQVGRHGVPTWYSGSLLSYSFSEAGQQKYALLVEAEPGAEVLVQALELKSGRPLLRRRVEGMEAAREWLSAHSEALVELTLVSESFLTAADRRQLNQWHPGIVALIPEVKDKGQETLETSPRIDPTKDLPELFRDYFKHRKGQEASPELLALLNEILAEDKQ